MNSKTESEVAEAVRVISTAYRAHVRLLAEEIIAELNGGDLEDDRNRELISDRIHEAADGSAWVIYTHRARMVLLVSEDPDAYMELGVEAMETDGALNWSALAFCALRADIEQIVTALTGRP